MIWVRRLFRLSVRSSIHIRVKRITIAKVLLQEPTRQKSVREDMTMIQRMGVYLNRPALLERGVVMATTCRTRWASLVARMSKYTYHS